MWNHYRMCIHCRTEILDFVSSQFKFKWLTDIKTLESCFLFAWIALGKSQTRIIGEAGLWYSFFDLRWESEPRASCVPGTYSITELLPQPDLWFLCLLCNKAYMDALIYDNLFFKQSWEVALFNLHFTDYQWAQTSFHVYQTVGFSFMQSIC